MQISFTVTKYLRVQVKEERLTLLLGVRGFSS